MSRTVRTTQPSRTALFRVGVGGAAAVLLLTACGGDPDPSSAATSAAEQGSAGEDATEFCAQAAGIDERVDAALADGEDDPSLSEAFRQIATDLRGIEPPTAIAADWTAMAAGLDRMADAFGQVDVTDLGSLEALEQAEGDLTEAGDRVDDYLGDECGI
jgi:hypothetical protein